MPSDTSDTRWPEPGVRDGRAPREDGHVARKTFDGKPLDWRSADGHDGGARPGPDGAVHDVLARAGAAMADLRCRLAAAEESISQLEAAVQTNRRIGMAVGILMALRKVTAEQAFDLLREASNVRNTKLRDVAEDVVRTGTLG